MNRYFTQLTKLARAYRAAEEAIVSVYFKRARRRTDHLDWLRAQAFKEYSAIKPILTALAKLYPEIDRGIDRHDFEELTEKIGDEKESAEKHLTRAEFPSAGSKQNCLRIPRAQKVSVFQNPVFVH